MGAVLFLIYLNLDSQLAGNGCALANKMPLAVGDDGTARCPSERESGYGCRLGRWGRGRLSRRMYGV